MTTPTQSSNRPSRRRVLTILGAAAGMPLAATLGDGPYERSGGWDEARSDIRAAISAAARAVLMATVSRIANIQ